jgi:hypothetical protein
MIHVSCVEQVHAAGQIPQTAGAVLGGHREPGKKQQKGKN